MPHLAVHDSAVGCLEDRCSRSLCKVEQLDVRKTLLQCEFLTLELPRRVQAVVVDNFFFIVLADNELYKCVSMYCCINLQKSGLADNYSVRVRVCVRKCMLVCPA